MSFFEALTTSFEAIGRLFLVALVGFIAVRRGWLTSEALSGVTRITIDVVVPCALSIAMLKGFRMEIVTEASPLILVPVLFVALGALVTFAVLRAIPGGNLSGDAAASALAAVPNSFYVPLPLAVALAPPGREAEAAVLVGAAVLAINPLQWTLGTYLLTAGTEAAAGRKWKESLLHVFNGPVIGIIAGAVLALFPSLVAAAHREPESLMPLRLLFGAMELTGQAMAPLAMIVLGGLIAQCPIRRSISLRHLIPVMLMRFLIVPGVVYWLIRIGQIPAAGLIGFVLILEAAAPPATNLALAARRYNGAWETASSLLLVTNFAALIALPIWMAIGLRL